MSFRLSRAGALLIMLWLAAMLLPTAAQETTPEPLLGPVSGHIVNGTARGTVPPELEVTLFVRGEQGVEQFLATADSQGQFSFPDAPVFPGAQYLAAVAYRNRIFTSEFITAQASPTVSVPITIYELTEDPAVITITGITTRVSIIGESMEVQQVINFRNTSDRLFTSSQALGENRFASLVITLPPGAVVLSFDNPRRYLVSPETYSFTDTSPVLPGDGHTVAVIYVLAYEWESAIIEQELNYPLDGTADLLVWPETLTVSGSQYTRAETQPESERVYQRYRAALQLDAGGVLRYDLSGAGAAATSGLSITETAEEQPSANILPLLLWIISAGALLAGALLFLRSRQQAAPAAPASDARIDALVAQIAALDSAHQAGTLNHDLWHRERQTLQAQLNALLGVRDGGDDDDA